MLAGARLRGQGGRTELESVEEDSGESDTLGSPVLDGSAAELETSAVEEVAAADEAPEAAK